MVDFLSFFSCVFIIFSILVDVFLFETDDLGGVGGAELGCGDEDIVIIVAVVHGIINLLLVKRADANAALEGRGRVGWEGFTY
jgi:hypothetical protein